jgi:spore germination protein
MKIKVKFMIAILSLFICLTLTGCWDQKLFEEVGFTLSMGIEESPSGELLISRTSPLVRGDIKNKVEFLSSEGGSIRDTRAIERRNSPKMIEAGKTQQVLISQQLAEKKEISTLLEVFHRNPEDAVLAFVIIVEGSPKELLRASLAFEDKPRSAVYLRELIEHNIKSTYSPHTTIYNFNVYSFAPGIDPITPIIKLDGDEIKIVGSALFSENKLVGKIEPDETPLMLSMMNKLKSLEYLFGTHMNSPTQDSCKTKVSVLFTKVKRKISIEIKDNKPDIKIVLEFKGTLEEGYWKNPISEEEEKNMEEELSSQLKGDCEKVIKQAQKLGSDPIGLGDMVRVKYNSYWKSIDWIDIYKTVHITVDTKIDLINHGVIN